MSLERKLSWQTERKAVKEYKWHTDVKASKYRDVSATNVVMYIVAWCSGLMYPVHYLLDVLMIYDLYHLKHQISGAIVNDPSSLNNCNPFSNMPSDKPSCDDVVNSLNGMAIAYIVFTIAAVAINIYDAIIAYKIVISSDISDTFINVMASLYMSLSSFGRFCFFRVVGQKKTALDSFAMMMWDTLYQGKQFVADIPMFIIAYYYSKYTGAYSKEYEIAVSIAKAAFLALRFLQLIFFAVCYPIVRFCFVQGSIRKYASYRIDRLIELVLWPESHPVGSSPPPPPEMLDGASIIDTPKSSDSYGQPPPNVVIAPGIPDTYYAPQPTYPSTDYQPSYQPDYPPPQPMYQPDNGYQQPQPTYNTYDAGYQPQQPMYQDTSYGGGYPPQQQFDNGYPPPQQYNTNYDGGYAQPPPPHHHHHHHHHNEGY